MTNEAEQMARLRQEKAELAEEQKLLANLESEQKDDEIEDGRNWGLRQRYEMLRDCAQVGLMAGPRKVKQTYGFKPSLAFRRGVEDLFAEIEGED